MGRCAGIALIAILLGAARCFAATPDQIDQAITSGTAWLYSQQHEGHWESAPAPNPSARTWQPAGGQWGGTTALATYALLAAGEKPTDPRLASAIEFLKTAELKGVYAIALRAQVWQELPPTPQVQQLILKDAATLRAMLITRGPGRGFFDYVGIQSDNYSHSRGNYGVLGMWALAQCGVEVPADFWQTVEEGWIAHQYPDGGWSYKAPGETEHPVTPGMTAAGVATLFITQDYLAPDRGADCRPVPPFEPLERGVAWLVEHFDEIGVDQPHGREYHYPTWYALERVAVASGLRTFGEIDWYQRGADWLIEHQKRTGAWDGPGRGTDAIADTSFALLFLSRGRSPVVVNKLDYSTPDHPAAWNNRPRDVANLSRWIGRAMERDLHWQIVGASADLGILHEAPILYIAGRDDWTPSDDMKAKIKAYIESGGLVVAVAECQGRRFADAMRDLGRELFPSATYRPLPLNHPIYTHQQFKSTDWRSKPTVHGLSNGVRELIVIIPQGDPGRVWQMNNERLRRDTWELGANLVQYAIDQQALRSRGTSHLLAAANAPPIKQTVGVARLRYDGNWDPEPFGWTRLATSMRNGGVDLKVEPVSIAELPKANAKIAHLTGTEAIALDDEDKQHLRAFIDGGGTLLIDAAGGSGAFADSVESMLAQLFADAELKTLDPAHPLYTRGDDVLGQVRYRRYAMEQIGPTGGHPRVRGIEVNGRVAVFFSREDLSAGLVGQEVDGIIGYAPPDALRLMTRMIQHAQHP